LGIGVGFYLACKLYPLEKVFFGMAWILCPSGYLCLFTVSSSTTDKECYIATLMSILMFMAGVITTITGTVIQGIKYQKKCRQTIAQVLSLEPELNTIKIKTTTDDVYYLSLYGNSSAKNCFLHQYKEGIKGHQKQKIYIRFMLTPNMISGEDREIDVNKIRFVDPPKDISSTSDEKAEETPPKN